LLYLKNEKPKMKIIKTALITLFFLSNSHANLPTTHAIKKQLEQHSTASIASNIDASDTSTSTPPSTPS